MHASDLWAAGRKTACHHGLQPFMLGRARRPLEFERRTEAEIGAKPVAHRLGRLQPGTCRPAGEVDEAGQPRQATVATARGRLCRTGRRERGKGWAERFHDDIQDRESLRNEIAEAPPGRDALEISLERAVGDLGWLSRRPAASDGLLMEAPERFARREEPRTGWTGSWNLRRGF